MTTFNPAVAVIDPDTGFWATMPLLAILTADDGIDADACSADLGKGETWMEGGGAAATTLIINLDHRDTPERLPNRPVADLVYEAFCFHRGLPHVDAQENHIQQMLLSEHDHIDNTAIVNWLRAFVEVYDDLEE